MAKGEPGSRLLVSLHRLLGANHTSTRERERDTERERQRYRKTDRQRYRERLRDKERESPDHTGSVLSVDQWGGGGGGLRQGKQ